MEPNPALERLGLKKTDKVAILHVDDIGMCGATLDAFDDLWTRKSVTCGSVMVPCPWFRAAAKWARAHPDADLGVHATLTSEWPDYRWGPVSTRDTTTGLLDVERCFPPSVEEAAAANPKAVKAEIAMQVAMARDAGIDVTHLDTHMGSVMNAHFYGGFVHTAMEAGILPFALRLSAEQWRKSGSDEATITIVSEASVALERQGVPILDRVFMLSLSDAGDRAARTRNMLDKLRPGQIAYAIFHPALDTPELRGICPDWRSRVADYDLLASGIIRRDLESQGVTLIGCRELRACMRQNH